MKKSVNVMDQMAALGDTTRRNIFEILSVRPSSVVEIARQLPISRPAVSQHLRVLKDAGLVTLRSQGTRNIYHLDPKGIAVLRDHLDSLWQTSLNQFKAEAERSYHQRKEKNE